MFKRTPKHTHRFGPIRPLPEVANPPIKYDPYRGTVRICDSCGDAEVTRFTYNQASGQWEIHSQMSYGAGAWTAIVMVYPPLMTMDERVAAVAASLKLKEGK